MWLNQKDGYEYHWVGIRRLVSLSGFEWDDILGCVVPPNDYRWVDVLGRTYLYSSKTKKFLNKFGKSYTRKRISDCDEA